MTNGDQPERGKPKEQKRKFGKLKLRKPDSRKPAISAFCLLIFAFNLPDFSLSYANLFPTLPPLVGVGGDRQAMASTKMRNVPTAELEVRRRGK
jgi:hypothetical protein